MGFGSFFRCGPAFFGTTALPWKGGRIERLSNFSDYTSGLHGSGTARGSVKASQQSEDLELIHRSQAGDTEAFGELVTKYRAKIFTMLYGMVRNENDAWDLAQEGFLKAWRSIHQFRGSIFVLYVVIQHHGKSGD